MRKHYSYHSEIWLPRPRREVFAFFSDAQNLELLTPPWVNFKIKTALPIRMEKGALIDYRLKLHGIPIRWRTEITAWEPPLRFVDTQVKGPYRLWVHEHLFHEKDGGTTVIDDVAYRTWGGKLVDRWLVRPDVNRIFQFRTQKLKDLFPGPE